MRKNPLPTCVLIAILLIVMAPYGALAQNGGPGAAPAPERFAEQQLDQMFAPIALYPDSLLAQILIAATYPAQVTDAYNWLQANPHVNGDALNHALDKMDWDLSVKALAPFPQVLAMMAQEPQWTENMGEAFLGQEADVTASIQRLRQQARAAGNLETTAQQKVVVQNRDVEIEPANPEVIYVPDYNPDVVYGSWMWPDNPPYDYAPCCQGDWNYPYAGVGVGLGLQAGLGYDGFGYGYGPYAPGYASLAFVGGVGPMWDWGGDPWGWDDDYAFGYGFGPGFGYGYGYGGYGYGYGYGPGYWSRPYRGGRYWAGGQGFMGSGPWSRRFGYQGGVGVGPMWNRGWGRWRWANHSMLVNVNRNMNINSRNMNTLNRFRNGGMRTASVRQLVANGRIGSGRALAAGQSIFGAGRTGLGTGRGGFAATRRVSGFGHAGFTGARAGLGAGRGGFGSRARPSAASVMQALRGGGAGGGAGRGGSSAARGYHSGRGGSSAARGYHSGRGGFSGARTSFGGARAGFGSRQFGGGRSAAPAVRAFSGGFHGPSGGFARGGGGFGGFHGGGGGFHGGGGGFHGGGGGGRR